MINHSERFIQIKMNISFHRKKRSMSQSRLAEKAGLSVAQVNYIESLNSRTPISLEHLFDIADALGMDPAELIKY